MVRNITAQACFVCNEKPAVHGGRCKTCYSYWITHKKRQDRPPWTRQASRLCMVCLERASAIGPRCGRCHSWWLTHKGAERPQGTRARNHAQRPPPMCKSGCPRAAICRGLCQTCYQRQRRAGLLEESVQKDSAK